MCQGIEISTPRITRVLRRYQPSIDLGQGPVDAGRLGRALARPPVMTDLLDFQAHYMHDLIDELDDGRLDGNNENCQLFLDLMRQRHKLRSGVVIAGLMYVMEERLFMLYRDSMKHLRGAELDDFVREVALHDICCDTPYDEVLVQRFAADCGLRVGERRLGKLYWKARRDVEMSRFEKNLRDPRHSTLSIAEQIRSDAQRQAVDQVVSEHLDTDLDHYIIVGPDYSRDSRLDAHYRRHFSYVLSRAFDGHCCGCGEGMGALQFDHFWCPKASGGNFLMRSRDGVYVNNCIPLCASCNASKGKRDFRDVFDEAVVEDVVRRSQAINAFVNEHMIGFHDPDFPGRVGVDVLPPAAASRSLVASP